MQSCSGPPTGIGAGLPPRRPLLRIRGRRGGGEELGAADRCAEALAQRAASEQDALARSEASARALSSRNAAAHTAAAQRSPGAVRCAAGMGQRVCDWEVLPDELLRAVLQHHLAQLEPLSLGASMFAAPDVSQRAPDAAGGGGGGRHWSDRFRAVCRRWRRVHDRALTVAKPTAVPLPPLDMDAQTWRFALEYPSVARVDLRYLMDTDKDLGATAILRWAAVAWPRAAHLDLCWVFRDPEFPGADRLALSPTLTTVNIEHRDFGKNFKGELCCDQDQPAGPPGFFGELLRSLPKSLTSLACTGCYYDLKYDLKRVWSDADDAAGVEPEGLRPCAVLPALRTLRVRVCDFAEGERDTSEDAARLRGARGLPALAHVHFDTVARHANHFDGDKNPFGTDDEEYEEDFEEGDDDDGGWNNGRYRHDRDYEDNYYEDNYYDNPEYGRGYW